MPDVEGRRTLQSPFDKPAAFLSYVRKDDERESGRISAFRELLQNELELQWGESFPVFQDRTGIGWGQQWEKRIDKALSEATFLFPVVTPAFFKSEACRVELQRFLERETDLGRDDLVMWVYWTSVPALSGKTSDALVERIAKRQHRDLRELRKGNFNSPAMRSELAAMAEDVLGAIERARRRTVVGTVQKMEDVKSRHGKTSLRLVIETETRESHEVALGPAKRKQYITLLRNAQSADPTQVLRIEGLRDFSHGHERLLAESVSAAQ